MKNLIKKILKENEDEFGWAHDLDPSEAETDIKEFFLAVENDYAFEGEDLYNMIIEAGARDLTKIKAIGEFVYDEVQSVRDRGYDDGRDDCDCDGCCDDFVHYDTHEEEKEQAREEGYEEQWVRSIFASTFTASFTKDEYHRQPQLYNSASLCSIVL